MNGTDTRMNGTDAQGATAAQPPYAQDVREDDDPPDERKYTINKEVEPTDEVITKATTRVVKTMVGKWTEDDVEHLRFLARQRSKRRLKLESDLWSVLRCFQSPGHFRWEIALRPTVLVKEWEWKHNPFSLTATMDDIGYNFPYRQCFYRHRDLLRQKSIYNKFEWSPPSEFKEYNDHQQRVSESYVDSMWLTHFVQYTGDTTEGKLQRVVKMLIGSLELIALNLATTMDRIFASQGDEFRTDVTDAYNERLTETRKEGLPTVPIQETGRGMVFAVYHKKYSDCWAQRNNPHWELYNFWIHMIVTHLIVGTVYDGMPMLCLNICVCHYDSLHRYSKEAGVVDLAATCTRLVRGQLKQAMVDCMMAAACIENINVKLQAAEHIWKLSVQDAERACAAVRKVYRIGDRSLKHHDFYQYPVDSTKYSWREIRMDPLVYDNYMSLDMSWLGFV